jgi:hypothetical protein
VTLVVTQKESRMPDEMLDRAKRAFETIAPPPTDRARVERRARVLRRRRTATTASVAVVVALGIVVPLGALLSLRGGPGPAPADTEAPPSPTLGFEPATGWNVVTTDPSLGSSIGWQAWVANVPFAEGDAAPTEPENTYPGGFPTRTQDSLPPDGILLVAADQIQTENTLPASSDFPAATLPLSITQPPSTQFEGQPPNRAMTVVTAMVNGRYVDVRIIFGTADPSRSSIAEAQDELDRLTVAPTTQTTPQLDQFGVSMQLPDAWDGVLYREVGFVPELIASTRPITDLYDGSSIWRSMGPSDVVVILAENDYASIHYEDVATPISISPGDACPTCEIMDDGTSPPSGNALYYRGFALNGREFDLYVEFGTAPDAAQLASVNDTLNTLEIQPPTTPPPPSPSPSPFPPGPPASVHADLPVGWTASLDPVPSAENPRIVAAYGSWAFPTGGDCGPEPALAALPEDGAFVWVVEHSDPGNRADFVAPPSQFHLDLQQPPARWTCGTGAPSRVELFRIAGRYFEIHIALGPGAPASTVSQVDSLISSLDADPLA